MERDELMPSICERLRKVVGEPIGAGLARNWLANPDGLEAADLIETQAALLEEVEGVLARAWFYVVAVAAEHCADQDMVFLDELDATLAKLKEREAHNEA